MDENIYMTYRRCYSVEEAHREFRDKVSRDNWIILLSNLTDERYAGLIDGFTEIHGELFEIFDEELLSMALNM